MFNRDKSLLTATQSLEHLELLLGVTFSQVRQLSSHQVFQKAQHAAQSSVLELAKLQGLVVWYENLVAWSQFCFRPFQCLLQPHLLLCGVRKTPEASSIQGQPFVVVASTQALSTMSMGLLVCGILTVDASLIGWWCI